MARRRKNSAIDAKPAVHGGPESHEEASPSGVIASPTVVIVPPNVPVDTNCQRCGEPLPGWALYLGVCGDCLSEAKRPIRTIPRPGYRGE
jgi:hypothetical protein